MLLARRMTDWDDIECGFNAADETLNFGTRNIAGLENLYETSTLAVIKSTEENEAHSPTVTSRICNGKIFFAINSTMRIFSDLLGSTVSFQVGCGEVIDVFSTSSDGKYLVVGVRNGNVICFDAEDQAVLFAEKVLDNEELEQPYFVGAFLESELCFLIVTKKGELFRVTCTDIFLKKEASKRFTCHLVIDLQCNVAVAALSKYLCLAGEELCLYDCKENRILFREERGMKNIYTYNKRLFLGLDVEGRLLNICTKTFLSFYVDMETTYKDIVVYGNVDDLHLLGITTENKEGDVHLVLLSYPNFTPIFTIKVQERIHIVYPEHINDDVIYIAEVWNNSAITELRFQVISETSAENRFRRLLKRRKFAEAEHFAQVFNLDVSQIQKAKAQELTDKLKCTEVDVENLLKIFETIDDDCFKVESCLAVHYSCSNLDDVQKILEYGCKIATNADEAFLGGILHLNSRFHTFLALVRCSTTKSAVQDWDEFSVCNLLDELVHSLEMERIEEAIIIYSRLDSNTLAMLNEAQIESILEKLNCIPIKTLMPFLKVFLPLSISYFPHCRETLVQWIINKIFDTELSHPNEFPENAIDFVNEVMNLVKVDSQLYLTYQHHCKVDSANIKQLTAILEALERLKSLKEEYHVVISIQQFLMRKEILVETLLNRVTYIADREDTLENFIKKFILTDDLELDVVFQNLIKEITQYDESYWIKVVPLILNSITSMDHKLKATLLVLKSASVPWCAAVRNIANQSLQHSHSLVEEIVKQIEYEPQSIIIKKEPYKLKKQCLNSLQNLGHAVRHILYCNQPSMIDDIYQLCKNPNERLEADGVLLQHFIKLGEITKFLEILENISEEDRFMHCSKLLIEARFAIDNKFKMNNLQENFYQILGTVVSKLQANATRTQRIHLQKTLHNLRSVYNIQRHFNLKVTCADVESHIRKENILQELLSHISTEFQDTNDLKSCLKNCEKVAFHLDINRHIVFLKLCHLAKNFSIILEAAQRVLSEDNDVQSLCQIAAFILENIGTKEEQRGEESFIYESGVVEFGDFIGGLQLADKIITQAILKSGSDDIGYCFELANWLQTVQRMVHVDQRHIPPFLKNTYGVEVIHPSVSAFNAFQNFYKSKFSFTSSKRALGNRIWKPDETCSNVINRTFSNEINDEMSWKAEIEMLRTRTRCLFTEGHTFTAYKLLQKLQKDIVCNLRMGAILTSLTSITSQCVKHLLQIVFAGQIVDSDLAYNLLLSCDQKYARSFLYQTLKAYKRDASKFKIISKIYYRYLKYRKISEHQQMCETIICLFKWWKKIKNCQIAYEHFFKTPPVELVKNLIKLNKLDIQSMEDFCRDFNLDVGPVYELYLTNLLLNWKPVCEIKIDVHDKRQMVIKNSEDELTKSCLDVIKYIGNNEAAYEIITEVWNTVSFYHYEVFLSILNVMNALKPDSEKKSRFFFLIFLKNYNRASKPGKSEEEEWYTLFPDSQCLDPLSEWRLPFTPTLFSSKIMNIIRPEINLHTYSKWFEVTHILKRNLNRDDICSYVIKDIISSGIFNKEKKEEWTLHAKHSNLLLDIDKCLQNMTNVEQALSTIYCLTTNIPGGTDQVNAIKLCYKYALQYQKNSPQTEELLKAVTKVKKKYYNYSAMHILHTNHLAEKKYLDLVSAPVDELILALYMDERILKKATFVTSYCPDINNTVDELATLYETNIQEKQMVLLCHWLSSNNVISDFGLDTSMVFSLGPDNKSQTKEVAHSNNLIRATYMCSGNVSAWQPELLKLGDVKNNESRNLNFKANLLKCFCNISDPETIYELTGSTYEEFQNYINKLMLISLMECLGFSLNIDTVDKYNKSKLLTSLSNYVSNPVAVRAMASLCITYTIFEVKYWAAIINAMLQLKLINELRECVTFLKKSVHFYHKKFYINAWQAVIYDLFDVVNLMGDDELYALCVNNFYAMQCCPVLFAVDVEPVIKKFLNWKKYNFAALCIQYLGKEKQTDYLKKIVALEPNLDKKMEELAQYGFWGISFVSSKVNKSIKD